MQKIDIARHESLELWQRKISRAEKKYADYYDLVRDIREYYRNETGKNKQNIFWSSVETLKPFLYFKQPKPYIVRADRSSDETQNVACQILERALTWNMKQFDFDSVVKYARNDFLLSGFGLLWEQYCLDFKFIGDICLKDKEYVVTEYVNPDCFIADTEKVNVWEDVEWIARKTFMSEKQVSEIFAQHSAHQFAPAPAEDKVISVYEIWDKPSRKIYYLSPEITDDFLRVADDTLHLSGFFPCPKPIMATLTNDGIIPIPDYVEIKSLLDELDGINNRMRLTMQAIKISGCYDNAFPELANILNKDVTLIALNDFEKLKDAGGIKGVIDFAPVSQYVEALAALASRRKSLIDTIYEVTGVSDIMRGFSNVGETATAVNQKTNFGTLRNQDRQNDMQRFLRDLLRIKAEIICEQFSQDNLALFAPVGYSSDAQIVKQAVKLLKTEKIRDMIIDIETDTSLNQEQEQERVIKIMSNINNIISQAFNLVSAQPALLPLYKQMLTSLMVSMPNSRQFASVLEDAFLKISAELNEPKSEKPNNEIVTKQLELQEKKIAGDLALKAEQNKIKRDELALKTAEISQKISNK